MRTLAKAAALSVTVGLLACEGPESQPDRVVDPIAAFAPVAGCDTREAIRLMKGYLPKPLHRDASSTLRDLKDECAAQFQGTGSTQIVFNLLIQVEQVLTAGTAAGGPVQGAAYVNELLKLGAFGCNDTCAVPSAVFAQGGAFGVRGPVDTAPLVSSDPDPQMVWTLEPPSPGATWEDVLPQMVLFYGYPGSTQPASEETVISSNEFFWEKLPDVDFLNRDQPIVAYCGDGSGFPNPTVQRFDGGLPEGGTTLLQEGVSAVCVPAASADASSRSDWNAGSSLSARALRFATRWFGPSKLMASAAFGGGVGGKPRDFSRFVAVTSVPGTLEFVMPPVDTILDKNTGLTPPFTVEVRAASEVGTSLENIALMISVEDNNGSTVALLGDVVALTDEDGGVAVFEGLQLNKAGGYNMRVAVVQGGDEGFVIPEMISERFNVRGN